MNRTSIAVAGAAIALLLTACGSSSDNTDAERKAVTDEVAAGLMTSGATQEQADCVISNLSGVSTADLQAANTDGPSDAVQQALADAIAKCQ